MVLLQHDIELEMPDKSLVSSRLRFCVISRPRVGVSKDSKPSPFVPLSKVLSCA